MTRPSGRRNDEMRPVTIETGISRHAEGSCLISVGHTRVICTASLQEGVPQWLKGLGRGWVTAEYGMLPRATGERTRREAKSGGQSGRTQEIQRLIGRSLRAITDLEALGEHQIVIDCDVIQADGGTRCASITGGWVALRQCIDWMLARRMIERDPLRDHVAAVSCGIWGGEVILDLEYVEDAEAETDANFVITGNGGLVEIQATAEEAPFSEAQFLEMLALARSGVAELVAVQRRALGGDETDSVEV